jgi:hypothetical protein
MNPAQYYQFPADQSVEIYHDTFGMPHEGRGLVAVVAPTFTPGVSHVGIADVNGREWKFIHGPARVKTSRVWKWLEHHDECFPFYNGYPNTKDHDWSIPTRSLDDFIELVTGGIAL